MSRTFSKEDYEVSKSWGILTSIDLFDCNSETLQSADKIKEYIIELCKRIDMKRFGEPIIIRFGTDPAVQGYSAIQLIETSSISGHFAEESNSIYIDIFSCKFYNQNDAIEFTREFFNAKNFESNIILRGENISKH